MTANAMEGDRELCIACCRAYNDWLADYCSADASPSCEW